MHHLLKTLVFPVVAALVVTACSTSESAPAESAPEKANPGETTTSPTEPKPDAGPEKPGEPPKEPCAAFAEASCTRQATCTEHAFVLDWKSPAECVTRRTDECKSRLSAAGSTTKAENFVACATALKTFSCNDWLKGKQPTACIPPAGTKAIGAGCADDAQCQTGVCLLSPSAKCGKCTAKPAQFQTCSSSLHCAAGLACKPTSTFPGSLSECVPFTTEGGNCLDAACEPGLVCTKSPTQCVKAGTKDEVCGAFYGPCDVARGYVCDPLAGKCIAPKVFKYEAQCDGTGLCEAGTYCQKAPGNFGSFCIELPSTGEGCNTTYGCMAPARCIASKCEVATAAACN